MGQFGAEISKFGAEIGQFEAQIGQLVAQTGKIGAWIGLEKLTQESDGSTWGSKRLSQMVEYRFVLVKFWVLWGQLGA